MLENTEYDYIIIGDGIAAKLVLFNLVQSVVKKRILHISNNLLFRPCSDFTTATVSIKNETGTSLQAVLLQNSQKSFLNFLEKYKPSGVEKVTQTIFFDERDRYQNKRDVSCVSGVELTKTLGVSENEAYLIQPNLFYNWINNAILIGLKKNNYHHLEESVQSISKDRVVTEKSHFSGKKIICCMGAYSKHFDRILGEKSILSESKIVAGNYLEWNEVDLPNSFIFSDKNINLVYRKTDQTLMFGGTTNDESLMLHDLVKLRSGILKFQNILKVDLPKLENAKIKTGLRHKGKKRLPFWGEISENIYSIHSLYKNAFTFGFLAAEELIQKIGDS